MEVGTCYKLFALFKKFTLLEILALLTMLTMLSLLPLLPPLTLLTLLTLFTLFSLLKHCVQSGVYAYIYIAICLERSAGLAIWLYGPWLARKNWDGWSEYPHTLL